MHKGFACECRGAAAGRQRPNEVVLGGWVRSLHMLGGDSADSKKTCMFTRDSRVDHPPTCTPTHFSGGRHRELVYGCFLFLAKQPTRRPRTCGLDTVLTANDQRTDEAAGMKGRPVAKKRKGKTARTTWKTYISTTHSRHELAHVNK